MLQETAAVSVHSVYTIQPRTMSPQAKPHIYKVHAYLAVTCDVHFWQNDQDLSTVEKNFFLSLLQGFKPVTFPTQVQHSNHWAILVPQATATNEYCIMKWGKKCSKDIIKWREHLSAGGMEIHVAAAEQWKWQLWQFLGKEEEDTIMFFWEVLSVTPIAPYD